MEAKMAFEDAKRARIAGDYMGCVELLQRAAECGLAEAQFEYAWTIEFGYGVERSDGEAMLWYCKSALSGFAPAMAHLSELKRDANGGDCEDSLVWAKLAMASGDDYAMGFVFDTGLLGPVDAERARFHFERSAALGFPFAQESLGVILQESNPNDANILAAFKPAAQYGLPISQLALGDCYRSGLLLPRDLEAAFRLYAKGARMGDVVCMVTSAEVLYDSTVFSRVYPLVPPHQKWSIPASLLVRGLPKFVAEFEVFPDLVYDRLPVDAHHQRELRLASPESRTCELFQYGRLFRGCAGLLDQWGAVWAYLDCEDTTQDGNILAPLASAECIAVHAAATKRAQQAAIALLTIHRRRVPCLFTKYIPRDLGRVIARMVFESRVSDTHVWLPPKQEQQQEPAKKKAKNVSARDEEEEQPPRRSGRLASKNASKASKKK